MKKMTEEELIGAYELWALFIFRMAVGLSLLYAGTMLVHDWSPLKAVYLFCGVASMVRTVVLYIIPRNIQSVYW